MKGHTKIELKDVETGKVEVFEDDNMVTNALQYFLANAGPYSANGGLTEDLVTKYPLWQTYIGGLLLFDSAVEESIENVLPPAGVKMTGNGAYGVTNNADPTELGSYNTNESGVQEDGTIRMVWDFTTSQANGTIACACLTSRSGGYIGAGNATSKTFRTPTAADVVNELSLNRYLFDGIPYNVKTVSTNTQNRIYSYILYIDYKENALYYIKPTTIIYATATANEHWTSTGYIKVIKCRLPLTEIDLHYASLSEFPTLSTDPDFLEEYNVQIPAVIKTYMSSVVSSNRWKISSNGENIYIFFYAETNIVSPGNSFYILKLHKTLESFTTQLFIVTNTTESNITCDVYSADPWFFVTSDERLMIKRSTKDWININLADSTDVQMIDTGGVDINGFFIANDKIYTKTGFIDAKLNAFAPVNGNHSGTNSIFFNTIGNPLLYLYQYSGLISIIRNCQYLATINNLEEAVVKTSSKTMKVTYTIIF